MPHVYKRKAGTQAYLTNYSGGLRQSFARYKKWV